MRILQKAAQCLSLFVLLAACTDGSAIAADNQLSAAEKADGWQLLFNGEDMSQWRNFKQSGLSPAWVVQDGAMHLSAKDGGDILTRASYGDFELKLEWKISTGGNSGILVLADEQGEYIYSHAPEVQILDNEKHPDRELDSHRSGSLYDLVASHPSSHKKAGEWNRVRIRLMDDLLQVWQNGVMTTTLVLGSSTWDNLVAASKFADWSGFGKAREGRIGLQDHGDKVWFKNIKIRELD